MNACFFARVPEKRMLEEVEFYKQDIDILRDLGFTVHLAREWSEIPRDADLYYIWWWQWAFLPMLKAGRRGKPFIVTGAFDYHLYLNRPPWERWLFQYAFNRASSNLFISDFEFRQVTQALAVPHSECVSLAVDTNVYRQDGRAREDLALTVAWLNGPNAIRKCIPEVLQAIPLIRAQYPAMRFVIVGAKGTAYPRLAAMAEELGVQDVVEFTGMISRERKIDLMQRCKVYISPSRYEGFGLAILEAMSCGAPVVSSPVGSVPEVVGDAAFLVDGTSPDAIATATKRYLSEENLRKSLGARGRQRAEALFSLDRRREHLQRIVRAALNHRKFD